MIPMRHPEEQPTRDGVVSGGVAADGRASGAAGRSTWVPPVPVPVPPVPVPVPVRVPVPVPEPLLAVPPAVPHGRWAYAAALAASTIQRRTPLV